MGLWEWAGVYSTKLLLHESEDNSRQWEEGTELLVEKEEGETPTDDTVPKPALALNLAHKVNWTENLNFL